MSYAVLECDIVVTELHTYDFVIKKGCYLCQTLYILFGEMPIQVLCACSVACFSLLMVFFEAQNI